MMPAWLGVSPTTPRNQSRTTPHPPTSRNKTNTQPNSTYTPPEGDEAAGLPSGPTTVHVHGINALLMLMDLALARYPYQLKHFPAPLAFIASYLAFNFTYWSETGGVVYPSLDYSKPVGAVIMIAATIFGLLPATHLLLWRWELGCFVLSEKRRDAAARDLVGKGQDVEAGPIKAIGALSPLALTDAVLAMRRVPAMEEAEEVLQTPSTTGSGMGMSGGGEDIEQSPVVATAAGESV
jgi:hypothetical protein